METPILDSPAPGTSSSSQLSAPESYVLLHGPRAPGVEAFKKGLLELVARGVLTIETRTTRRFLVIPSRTSFLLSGPKASSVHEAPRPLRSIWDLYTRTSCFPPPGVRIRDLPRAARRLGAPLGNYAGTAVLPALREHGLYRRENYSVRGQPPRTRYIETAAGAATRAELQSLLERAAREFGADGHRDPKEAAALASALGPAMFLLDLVSLDTARLISTLREGMGTPARANGFGLYASSLDEDFAAFDPSALDGLAGAFDAIGDMSDGGSDLWGDGGGDGDGGGSDSGSGSDGDSGSDGGGGGD